MKSHDIELEEWCTKFPETFSLDGSWDVELYDLILELKTKINFARWCNVCYGVSSMSKKLIVTLISPFFITSYLLCLWLAFKVEIAEELFEVNNGSERLDDSATFCIEKKLLDNIDIDPIIIASHGGLLEENLKVICINYLICKLIIDAFKFYR